MLHYRVNNGNWASESLILTSGDTYKTTIDVFLIEDLIEYYITAVDNYIAHNIATDDNDGSYYSFTIEGSDSDGPTIENASQIPIAPTDSETITISCTVTDPSGVQYVTLFYRVNEVSFLNVSMVCTSGDIYEATIGAFDYADEIRYAIFARDSFLTQNAAIDDNSGAYYIFTVSSSDVTAPTISDIEYNPNTPSNSDQVNITCTVSDLNEIDSVVLHYRINEGSWVTTSMFLISDDQYKAIIGPFAVGSQIEFYITATDDSRNSNTAIDDNEGAFYRFTVLTQTTSNSTLLVLLPIVAMLALTLTRKKQ